MFTVCSNLNNIIWGNSNFREYWIDQNQSTLNTPLVEKVSKLFPGSAKIISWPEIRIDKIAFKRS